MGQGEWSKETEGETLMDAVIDLRDLTKSFGGVVAVDRLTLSVPKGAVFALLGDNGAGKTTTLRMLAGLLPPDSGRATVLGKDAWAHAVALRRKVAYFPERPRYYDWMTVAEIGWFTAGFQERGFLERYQQWTQKFLL